MKIGHWVLVFVVALVAIAAANYFKPLGSLLGQ